MAKKFLGIVVARGNSKGIPGKNIRTVAGKPLIHWAIDSAKQSKSINKLILSTDSEKISEVCKDKIEIPFQRPANLAEDNTLVIDVLKHAIQFYNDKKEFYDYVVLIQPTSPLIDVEYIDQAIKLAEEKDADTVISVFNGEHTHPSIMFNVDDDGKAKNYFDSMNTMMRRQDYPKVFVRCGLFYVVKTDLILKKNTLYGDKVFAIEVPEKNSLCIDNEYDLELAEFLLNKYGPGAKNELTK